MGDLDMLRILIVDDEPWARKVVRSLAKFDDMDMQVIGEADDGINALEMIEELSPDIVITDMRMPGMDGVELLRDIRERYPYIHIIAMSGYNDFIYLKEAIRSRAVEYLLKPINPAELNKALEQAKSLIERERKNALTGYGTLHLFEDSLLLNEYLAKRSKLFECLLTLEVSSIETQVNELKVTCNKAQNISVKELQSKILHDFTENLEEFMIKNDIELGLIRENEIEQVNNDDINATFDQILKMYIKVIHSILDKRKNKNKLDLQEVATYIELNYMEPLTLDLLANRFYVSKEHLSRSFKGAIGITVNEYLIKIRMNKASSLLKDSVMPIKDIVSLVGYDDVAYFYRVFKKFYGLAPGEYRDKKIST